MGLAVVTGATGHLGSNLVRRLIEQGRETRAIVRSGPGHLEGLDLQFVQADVCDRESLDAAVRGAEVVFHLAAHISITGSQGGKVEAVNVQGARNVADACLAAGVKRMVHVSSCHAFDINQPGVANEQNARPGSTHPAYDRSKAAGEAQVREVVAQGLSAVIVNPTAVTGPADPEPGRIGRTILNMARGSLPALMDGGFNWVDVRDVVSSILAAEEQGAPGENHLLGGHWYSLRELAEFAQAAGGAAPPRFTSPSWAVALGAPFMMGWHMVSGREPLYTTEALHALRATGEISSDKAARVLGHHCRPTEETVADLLDWFREQGQLK